MPGKHARSRTPARTLLIVALGLLSLSCAGRGSAGEEADGPASRGLSIEPADANVVIAAVAASEAKTIVMNVWATWCGPCREEFPDLMQLREAYAGRGLELVLVSADFDDRHEAALAFLDEQGVDFPTWIKTGDDMEFIDTLNPEWGGTLPATFVYDSDGRLRAFWEGKASYEQMEERVLPFLEESNRR